MAGQHTPGPWSFRGRYVGTTNHMSFIAECRDQNGNWTDTPMSAANARLIAAAPELLEALKEAVDLIVQITQSRWSEWEATEAETVGDFRAAIAKATGADQ